jgi:hypothetical protein
LAKLATTGTGPKLEFYFPSIVNSTPVQGDKSLSIDGTSLKLYHPGDPDPDAILSSTGLVLKKGGIEAGRTVLPYFLPMPGG